MKVSALLAGAAIAAALVSGARAETYTMDVAYAQGQYGDTTITVNGYGGNPWTTPILMTKGGVTTVVFCDDLWHDFYPGNSYQLSPGKVTTDSQGHDLTAPQSNRMGLIADAGKAYYASGDQYAAVAAQAAIWDVEYFGGQAPSASTVFSTNTTIEQDIQTLLNDIPENPNGHFAEGFISSDGSQSQILGAPEAPTWAMLALGFAGFGYAGLRRGRANRGSRFAV